MPRVESRSSMYFTDRLIQAYYSVTFLFTVMCADKIENRSINMAGKFHSLFMNSEHCMFSWAANRNTQANTCVSHTHVYILVIKLTRRTKSSNFTFGIKLYIRVVRTVPLSIISFSLYTQQCYMSYRFAEFFTVHTAMLYVIQVCWIFHCTHNNVYVIQVCWKLASCQQTCMMYNTAVCTVKNSWWWTEELSKILVCRVLLQK